MAVPKTQFGVTTNSFGRILLALLFLLPPAAFADTIDQQNSASPCCYAVVNGAQGQSFTPTLNSISFATFSFYQPSGLSVSASLLDGDGLGGTVLATSINSALLTGTGAVSYTSTFCLLR